MIKTLNFFLIPLAPVVSGILLYLGFPTYDFHWLAWVGLVPLLLAIHGKRPWQAFLLCFLAGFVFCLGMSPIQFLSSVGLPARLLAYIYVSLYFGLFGLCLSFPLRRTDLPLLIAAPIWVVFEYARSNFFFLAFGGGLLGHTQYLNIPLIQLASFTGVYGISFMIVLANAAIADLFIHWVQKIEKRRPSGSYLRGYNPIYGGIAVLLSILILWLVGWTAIPKENSGRPFSIAVVQGNIPQEVKWNREYRDQIIARYEELSQDASKANPSLIVWPEASTPGFVLKDLSLLQHMVSMVREINTYLLVGSAEYPKFAKTPVKPKKSGNTAIFFSPDGKILGQYIKIRLVPFAEYIPHEEIIPWPDFVVSKKKTNFHTAGTDFTLFGVDGTRFGTLICWEVLFPDLTRSFVKKGANFLVNLSNEAWFGKSAVPYQILCISVFRAVENRVNLVRSTNTGISCFIDPYGRITDRVINGGQDIFVEGTLTRDIYLSPTGTFYTSYGDVFVYGCIVLSLGLLIWSFLRKSLRNKVR